MTKFIIPIIVSFSAFVGTYYAGKTAAEKEYEILLKEQKDKVIQLENREKEVEKVIVTEYKDRVQYINKTKKETVEVIKEVIKNENSNCVVGSGFVSLFNASASGEALSSGPSRADGEAEQVAATLNENVPYEVLIQTIVNNHYEYHLLAERMIKLQEWTEKVRTESLNVNNNNQER